MLWLFLGGGGVNGRGFLTMPVVFRAYSWLYRGSLLAGLKGLYVMVETEPSWLKAKQGLKALVLSLQSQMPTSHPSGERRLWQGSNKASHRQGKCSITELPPQLNFLCVHLVFETVLRDPRGNLQWTKVLNVLGLRMQSCMGPSRATLMVLGISRVTFSNAWRSRPLGSTTRFELRFWSLNYLSGPL